MDIHQSLRWAGYLANTYPENSGVLKILISQLAGTTRQEHLMTPYEVGQTCAELNLGNTENPYTKEGSVVFARQFERGYNDAL